MPPRPPVVPVAVVPSGSYHTVVKGQTLWRIAREYGVDIHALMAANGISDPSRLEAGRRLLIPQAPAAVAVAPAYFSEAEVERLVGSPKGRVLANDHRSS